MATSDLKTTWNIVKRDKGKMHLTEQIPYLFTDNGTVKDPETVTNAFNNFLVIITESLNIHKWKKRKPFHFKS
jgi:hypothetical protein